MISPPSRSRSGPTYAVSCVGAGILLVSVLLFLALRVQPQLDPVLEDSWFHFQIVSFTSLVAFVLALFITLVTGPVAGVRTLFTTLALAAIAGMFLIHGLTTPGVLVRSFNPAVQWSSAISLFVGALLFACAAWPWSPAQRKKILAHRKHLWLVGSLCYIVYVIIAFLSPSPLAVLSSLTPLSEYTLGGVAIFLYVYAAYRFWHTYRTHGRRLDAVAAIALVLLGEAVVPMMFAPLWNLSWWLYHVVMLVAFSLVTMSVVLEYEHVRHFHLTYYFAGISVIATALLTWIAGELAIRFLGPFVPREMLWELRWSTVGIFAAMSTVLLILLLQIVQRGDMLLTKRTAQVREQEVALERSRMAGALAPIGLAIGSTLDLDEVLGLICAESLRLFNVDAAYLWLKEDDELIGRAGKGHKHDTFIGLRQSLGDEQLLGARIVREGRPVYVNYARGADQVKPRLIEMLNVEALMGVPFLHDGDALGALMLIDTTTEDRFTQLDLDVATIFGQQAAMALTHANLYETTQQQAEALAATVSDLRESYQATLHALSAALDARDRETEGHSQRVRAYTLTLADGMEITDDETREAIEWGALLHDVGKIGIPDAILHKPGSLSDDEWILMRQHPRIGYEILSDIPFLEPALPVVLYHHEEWDGSGYPTGVAGEDIPLPARIFSVADTFDAITSTRPYRAARSFERARDEILRNRGTQFDPEVVDAFAAVPLDTWRRLANHTSTVEQRVALPTTTG